MSWNLVLAMLSIKVRELDNIKVREDKLEVTLQVNL